MSLQAKKNADLMAIQLTGPVHIKLFNAVGVRYYLSERKIGSLKICIYLKMVSTMTEQQSRYILNAQKPPERLKHF
ncbi:hypothetical protein ASU80_20340 [Enterobacter hormaechei subsp. xiangfangensis]|nr:hypothetical protein ASV11_21105 [Enterobacter hormaechei subsp. xiangfangensis]KTJ63456.1 hypothetical protein ASU80_20340 [Enterobacter hormaechei subsp. xiangfangensis]